MIENKIVVICENRENRENKKRRKHYRFRLPNTFFLFLFLTFSYSS